jgi:hypothetical protein
MCLYCLKGHSLQDKVLVDRIQGSCSNCGMCLYCLSYIRKSPELSQNGPYCNRPIANNKSPGYIQSLHLDGFASSGALSQNSSSNNRQFTNNYNYDSCKSVTEYIQGFCYLL